MYTNNGSYPFSYQSAIGAGVNGAINNTNSSNVVAGFVNGSGGGGLINLNRKMTIAGSGSYSFGGNVTDATTTGENTTLIKEGIGTQTLSGSNQIATFNVNSGTLRTWRTRTARSLRARKALTPRRDPTLEA